VGRFAYLAERGGGRTLWFDKIVWNNFGQPQAGPGARQRAGVWPMDGPNNPSRTSRHRRTPPKQRFAYLAERGGGRTFPGSTNSSGTNLDDRRSAPERAARRGEPHGWGSQSLTARQRDTDRSAPLTGRFAYLTSRRGAIRTGLRLRAFGATLSPNGF